MLLAYFSPEVTLPVASALATVTGLALASGRFVGLRLFRFLRLSRRE